MTGQALAWVGGLALVLGVIFFLSLAFSRGWILPEYRVLIGLVAGIVCIAGGAAFMERGNRLMGHVLTPLGLASISISLVGATRLYDLIPVEVGLGAALASAVAAAIIAIRGNSPVVAGFGLVSVLVAPPILDAPADLPTLGFVGVVLVGTTIVAVWRGWTWLPAIAFVLSAPQAAAWIGGRPDPTLGLAGLGAFWALNAVAAGGEEFRRRRNDLSATSATLLVANAVFLVAAGYVVLSSGLESYRGAFLVVAAIAHAAVGGWFVARDGERNLFGLLALGTGIALLTMAAPAQLGAPAVAIAWTAEAVALTWLAVRRSHPYSAILGTILFILAAAEVIWVHQRAGLLTGGGLLLDGESAALAFFAAGVAAGMLLLPDRSTRSALAALGFVTVAWCLAERLDGLVLVVAMTALASAGIGVMRLLPTLPRRRIQWQIEGLVPRSLASLDDVRPILDHALAGAVVFVAGAATVEVARAGDGAVAYAWAAVVGWTGLGVAAVQLVRLDSAGRDAYRLAAFVGIIAAATVAALVVAPPTRLVVTSSGIDALVAAQSAIALGVLVMGMALLARSTPSGIWRRWVWASTGFATFYLLSVAPVDVVAAQVGRGLALDELRTQGQVALSVAWAVTGVVAFVAGLRRRTAELRQAGLGLLGLATAKVFVFDLAALEIAYRVISLVALGLLLLASAWVWQRLQPRVDQDADRPLA